MLLVFYALPNGNTIEQTIGKAIKPGDDWHFDIQHIGAQTRFLRGEDHGSPPRRGVSGERPARAGPPGGGSTGTTGIPAILDAVRDRFPGPATRIVLSGHSGGGSLIFGYLNCVATIPDQVERIAFLDANYAYETDRHRDKLVAWLKASDPHYLVVLAYNDAPRLTRRQALRHRGGGHLGPQPPDAPRPRDVVSLRETARSRNRAAHRRLTAGSHSSSRRIRNARFSTPFRWNGTGSSRACSRARSSRGSATPISANARTQSSSAPIDYPAASSALPKAFPGPWRAVSKLKLAETARLNPMGFAARLGVF